MSRLLFVLSYTALSLSCRAQDAKTRPAIDRAEFAGSMSFEMEHAGSTPKGWGGGPAGTISVDDKVVHSGRWSVRIERHTGSPQSFATVTRSMPVDFSGEKIELRGFLRPSEVSEFVGLWLRQDGDSSMLALNNMQQRQLKAPRTGRSIRFLSRSRPKRRESSSVSCSVGPAKPGRMICS